MRYNSVLFFFIHIFFLSFICSCSDSETQYELSIDKTSEIVDASANTIQLTISSNGKWEVSSHNNWITPSVTQGNGTKTISIKIDENESYDERIGSVQIYNDEQLLRPENYYYQLVITQKQKNAIIVHGDKIESEWIGGEYELAYEENVNASYSISGNANWVHITKDMGTRALVKHNIKISIDENDGPARQCKLVISGGENSKEITISQNEYVPIESISFSEKEINIVDEEPVTVEYIITPSNASDKSLNITYGDNSIVESKDEGDGKIKLIVVGNGNTSMTITNPRSGLSATLPINVKIKATKLVVDNADVNANYGYVFSKNFYLEPKLAYDDIQIISSNSNIVRYQDGIFICGNSDGEAIIEISSPYSNLKESFRVFVKEYYSETGIFEKSVNGDLNMRFVSTIKSNNKTDFFNVSSVSFCKEDGTVLASTDSKKSIIDISGNNSNDVVLVTPKLNMTTLCGFTSVDDAVNKKLEKYYFDISYSKGYGVKKQVKHYIDPYNNSFISDIESYITIERVGTSISSISGIGTYYGVDFRIKNNSKAKIHLVSLGGVDIDQDLEPGNSKDISLSSRSLAAISRDLELIFTYYSIRYSKWG